MRVIIDPRAGFCPGVRRAITQVEQRLRQGEPLIALGALIHNDREIHRLEKLGLKTIPQEAAHTPNVLAKEEGTALFVRTHGVSSAVENELHDAGLLVRDGTCATVKRVQKLAAQHHQLGEQIVIIGKKTHPEVAGINGYCDDQAFIVESEEDIKAIDPERQTLVIAQTTIGKEHFRRLSSLVRQYVKKAACIDTTCAFINRRYDQIRAFARSVDVLVFVGGKESSNSKVLFKICYEANNRSYKIESPDELDLQWVHAEDSVGITGGASTPLWQFEEIRTLLLGQLKSDGQH